MHSFLLGTGFVLFLSFLLLLYFYKSFNLLLCFVLFSCFAFQSVSDMLKAEFPGTKFLLGPGLHRVAPGVEEVRSLMIHQRPFRGPRNIEYNICQVWSYQTKQYERATLLTSSIMLHFSYICTPPFCDALRTPPPPPAARDFPRDPCRNRNAVTFFSTVPPFPSLTVSAVILRS